jgi:hypothetical protein
MMKRLFLAAAIAIALAGPAAADTLDALLKNTLLLVDAQGGLTTVQVSEEGKFEQTNARGVWATGFWEKEEGRLCMTARGEARLCMPLEADKTVGDSWEIRGPTGRLVWTATIAEGRRPLEKAAATAAP